MENRHYTLLGKVLVINTIIYPLFYFVAPVFHVPDSVVRAVYRIVFAFVWGENKTDLVSRTVISLQLGNGGLSLDNFRLKLDALLVKPLLNKFIDDTPPVHLTLTLFFVAKQLRKYYPHVWSNMRPNSNVCTDSLVKASNVY